MSALQEKEVMVKFKVASYDINDIDFIGLHNSIMLHATEHLSMFAVVGGFTLLVTDKKVKS